MGWGNHHARYDEWMTEGDVLAHQINRAAERAVANREARDTQQKQINDWLQKSRDMTPEAAKAYWDKLYPPGLYAAFSRPAPCMPQQLPPTPVDRPVDSPLWWATKGRR